MQKQPVTFREITQSFGFKHTTQPRRLPSEYTAGDWRAEKLSELPPLIKRAIVCEVRRQCPQALGSGKKYLINQLLNYNESLKGLSFWQQLQREHFCILFNND